VTDEDQATERASGIGHRLGSTCSGTGAAVIKRAQRRSRDDLAVSSRVLAPFIGDVSIKLRETILAAGAVIIEGTQGFGLSVLHSREFPKVTSRDTSAAGAISEAGLSPRDVDDVVLVLRAFPIRVAGDSGGFGSEEIDWATVAREGGHPESLVEYTSVTLKERRIARFDGALARRAIAINQPTTVVLNHVDHVDGSCAVGRLSKRGEAFVGWVEGEIEHEIDLIGLSPASLVSRQMASTQAA
jgi:adenylosuccinate synthase